MSEASEAKDATVASAILKQIVGDKEDNSTYRAHIREPVKSNFFYAVLVADGCSISVTANGKDAAEWRSFALKALIEILSHRQNAPDEDGEAYQGKKNGGETPGYG